MTDKYTKAPWNIENGTDVFTELGATNSIGIRADTNDGWQIADFHVGSTFVNGDLCGLPYAEQKANAEHVVKCVNAHDKLIEALERFLSNSSVQVNSPFECEYADKILEALKSGENND